MPTRKMRIEVFDGEGNRYNISFEGQITREKALRLLDLVELLGGIPNDEGNAEMRNLVIEKNFSKYDKMRALVQRRFPLVWFTSRDVQLAFEQEFKEPVGLSTVATYLSRMSAKGLLTKTGASKTLKYKLTVGLPKTIVEQKT